MTAFEILPALDVSGGRLARMTRGDPASLRTRTGDPVEEARTLVAQGARWIHVVDLDAATGGEPRNLDVLATIAALGVRVQAGGGLSEEAVADALGRGASRAVLGAAALADEETVRRTVERWGERVGVALDVRAGRVSPRGRTGSGPTLAEALALLAAVRPAFVVYTDVERDGLLGGPDVEGLRRVAGATGVPVVASGGIGSLRDVREVAALWPAVTGAIVGRALHEGRFTVRQALVAAERAGDAVLGGP